VWELEEEQDKTKQDEGSVCEQEKVSFSAK
jgi:hypothetical protein